MVGSIIFVRTSSPISWIIRKITRSEFSHVCVSCSEDNSWIIEADIFKKVKPRRNRYEEFEVVDFDLTDSQRLQLLQYFLEQTDEGYDYRRILGILLFLLGLTKDQNLWNTANRTICNELIIDGYATIGYNFKGMTPAELANMLLGKQSICNCG